MQDRLAELRRQRALVADHLAWLDREIAGTGTTAAEKGSPTPPHISEVPAVSGESVSPVPPTAPTALPPNAAAILASTKPTGAEKPLATGQSSPPNPTTGFGVPIPDTGRRDVRQETRKGCFVYVLIASVATALGIWLLVWASHSAWVKEEAGPYIVKAAVLALILALVASLRSLVAKLRSK